MVVTSSNKSPSNHAWRYLNIKKSQRKLKIHLNNSHVNNHENATNSQINLHIDTSQNKRNPRHKSNVVLDKSLYKTLQAKRNGGSFRYPRALTKAMQSTNLARRLPIHTNR